MTLRSRLVADYTDAQARRVRAALDALSDESAGLAARVTALEVALANAQALLNAHASRHEVGGADALTTFAPAPLP